MNGFSQERDQAIEALSEALEKHRESASVSIVVPEEEGPRRSRRLTTQTEPGKLQADLNQCRAELFTKTQGRLWLEVCSEYVSVLEVVMVIHCLVLFADAELTKLKMQLEVPGSAGTLTSAADRKLEEGQRVSHQHRGSFCFAPWESTPFL